MSFNEGTIMAIKIKNIRGCVLKVQGIGEIQPNEVVEMPDNIARSCLTAPETWEEVKTKPKRKRRNNSIFMQTKVEKLED
jgi:hypothetical protein